MSSVTDVFNQVVSYTYDANSNRTQLNLNAATNATYQYDVINRLTQLTDSTSLNTTFAYDATNKLTSRTLPNGVVSTWDYDGLNRLTRLKDVKGTNTLADFQYQFNGANNITQMIDDAGTHDYTYDSLDRLTAATHPNQPNESYTYDDVGNRTASHQGSSYTYQAFNRLVTANGTSFGYDANGNQISKIDGVGNWIYSWDYENRLKQASLSGGVVVNYSYDALGRRVQRASSVTGTTKYIYDADDVVRELDTGGNITADYLNATGIDDRLRQTVVGNVSYFLADHLRSTRFLTDASGNLSSNLSYDSFGNVTGGSAATRYTFTGREPDSDVGIMFYRARWYDAITGRFTSEDPIGLRADVDFYAYTSNNPVNYFDPSGLELDSVYRKMGGATRPTPMFPDEYDWWGHFWRDLFIERQDCRPPKSWGGRWLQSFSETNQAIPGALAPSLVPGVGLGALTSRATANAIGAPTLWEWASSGFGSISKGAAQLTPLETGVTAAASAAVNFLYVSIAWEVGVTAGSAINASFPRHCECK